VADRHELTPVTETETVAAPGPGTGPGAGPFPAPRRPAGGLLRAAGRAAARYAGVVPFGAYAALGLLIPMIAVIAGAFQDPGTGAFTTSNVSTAVHGVYLSGFRQSIILSVLASVIPGIFGFLIAYAIFTSRASFLRQVVITVSGVFAHFGGVPLAFLFVSSLGSSGLITGWLGNIGLHLYDHGFSLYTLSGVAVVYMYFQIPLMVLVILPALEGLRPAWREAAENLGARGWQYWRYVAGPVLFPSFLGCVLLLFGSALSAYATAEALTSGTIPLTSIQIGSFLNGNVLAGQENVGKALSLGMVVIITAVMGLYVLLQRRAAKWLR
jgi:putative spermidine/putrescine transport system permease protein